MTGKLAENAMAFRNNDPAQMHCELLRCQASPTNGKQLFRREPTGFLAHVHMAMCAHEAVAFDTMEGLRTPPLWRWRRRPRTNRVKDPDGATDHHARRHAAVPTHRVVAALAKL